VLHLGKDHICYRAFDVSNRILFLSPTLPDGRRPNKLLYRGGWLLTTPEEDFELMTVPEDVAYNHSVTGIGEYHGDMQPKDRNSSIFQRKSEKQVRDRISCALIIGPYYYSISFVLFCFVFSKKIA